jgi:recombination DNA repair RAD52 pathway protein
MSFSANQIRKLQRDVKTCDIRTREVNGRELSYIEGWHAISEANRIFGFDGWNRETIETRCVLSRDNRGTHHVVYVAKVRITVRAETETVVREAARLVRPMKRRSKRLKPTPPNAPLRPSASHLD